MNMLKIIRAIVPGEEDQEIGEGVRKVIIRKEEGLYGHIGGFYRPAV